MGEITITLGGRGYRVACDDGEEERLAELGRVFEARVEMLRKALGELGDMRLLVMAGVTLCDELDESGREIERLKAELAGDNGVRAAVTAEIQAKQEGAAAMIEEVAERLERLARDLGEDVA